MPEMQVGGHVPAYGLPELCAVALADPTAATQGTKCPSTYTTGTFARITESACHMPACGLDESLAVGAQGPAHAPDLLFQGKSPAGALRSASLSGFVGDPSAMRRLRIGRLPTHISSGRGTQWTGRTERVLPLQRRMKPHMYETGPALERADPALPDGSWDSKPGLLDPQ